MMPPSSEVEEELANFTALPPEILQNHILTRLDGASLASLSCASSSLRQICRQQSLWVPICHAKWPSTATPHLRRLISAYPNGGPFSFFSDASLLPISDHPPPSPSLLQKLISSAFHFRKVKETTPSLPEKLISAVDIYYKKKCLFSRVIEAHRRHSMTYNNRFHIRGIYNDVLLVPIKSESGDEEFIEEDLQVSWIVADPASEGRVLNISGRRTPTTLAYDWTPNHWKTTYVTVIGGGGGGGEAEELVECKVTVTFGRNRVTGMWLNIQDIKGNELDWEGGFVILHKAMSGGRGGRMKWMAGIEEGQRRWKLERARWKLNCLWIFVSVFWLLWFFFPFVRSERFIFVYLLLWVLFSAYHRI